MTDDPPREGRGEAHAPRLALGLGGLAAAALGAGGVLAALDGQDAEAASGGARRGRVGPRHLRAHAGDDRGAVLPRRRQGAPRHPRGAAGTRLSSPPPSSTSRPASRSGARAVDIWHCDAGGDVLRLRSGGDGRQGRSCAASSGPNANGLATFTTVYPGWYSGRTVHIHVKVSLGGNVVHTGQLFFPDALTDAVYRRAPYRSRPDRDTRNATDSIFRNGGSTLDAEAREERRAATSRRITMGVSRS